MSSLQYKHIAQALKQAGIPAGPDRDRSTKGVQDWFVTDDGSIAESIADWAKGYVWIRCIRLARFCLNDSCGLHAHVGHGGDDFTPLVLRNLMATLWTLGDRIDLIHSEIRGAECTWAPNLDYSRLAKRLSEGDRSRRDGLEDILAMDTSSLRDIVLSFRHHEFVNDERLNYNKNNLKPRFRNTKKTIECRQHESTLDPIRVANWIRTCAKYYGAQIHEEKREEQRFEAQQADNQREDEKHLQGPIFNPPTKEAASHPMPIVPAADGVLAAKRKTKRFPLDSESELDGMETIDLAN
ncbi:hypothetical protein G7Y89_g5670 [Cudoniella acicularis]|uniref:Uncharacterized protein n=1 Tax=Cudoniella acicularis TaxID=354080 RepID=A0A8H4RNF9_9HELO|nr:hypothetical protein G7Y89_g5670 [Cudoniella acicularis]